MSINHAGGGGRVVSSEHVNARGEHVRVVNTGGRGHGYVSRSYVRGGRPYMNRTYYRGGRAYARAYPGYYWHGHPYYGYAPGYWYHPGFYGWAYAGWAVPVAFAWGWGAAPWYGYYGYYFNPYPVYAAPSLWLTDYIISQNLQAAYEASAANAAAANAAANAAAANAAAAQEGGGGQVAANNNVVLTPEVKQAIADEVKAALAAQQAASANPAAATAAPAGDQLPAALDPAHRTFIVATALSEQLPDGMECTLSQGDVLTRIDDTPDANDNVKVIVSGSQKSDCNAGAQISVAVNDLQDMHNAFQEKLEDGLGQLAKNQGKNGMPASPSAATTPGPGSDAQPDQDAVAQLQKQQTDADAAEKEVAQASGPSGY
jgi:hypothetical protein